jgi:hypothetical protein
MLGSFPRFVLALALLPTVAACVPNEPCIETVEIIDFKDDTLFGMSPSEAVTRLGLPFSGPMGYSPENPAAPEIRGLVVNAEIAIAYAEGEVRYFDSEVNPDYRSRGIEDLAADFGERCPDRIEVDLTTTFSTDDGRFAEEELDGTMTMRRDPWAVEQGLEALALDFRAELPVDALRGTFTREQIEGDLARLILSWSPPNSEAEPEQAGRGSLDVEIDGGDWVSYGLFAWIGEDPFDGEN